MNLKIKNAIIKEINYTDPVEFFKQYSHHYYSTIFTGKGLKDIAEFSFIGIIPHTIITYRDNKFLLEQQAGKTESKQDFWEFLDTVLNQSNFDQFPYPAMMCGGVGYLSYEALHKIETVEKLTNDNYTMPYLEWVFYNRYFVFDHLQEKCWQIDFEYEETSFIRKYEEFPEGFQVDALEMECNAREYQDKVQRIREYILEGDVYEVNLSQQYRATFEGNPFTLFQRLFDINDAPYSAYMNFGEQKIISNSPEMFLRCKDREVETRPIKGTIKRSEDPQQDGINQQLLLNSEKDQAELYMIIDLLRNDIGKVCEYGSVKVWQAKRLETYKNVYHLVGIIKGQLRENVSYWDLLRATFPGGSITGCPKVRCLEIIEELETYSRNLYTGTIFMMNKKYFNSNIVIRSGIISNNRIFFNSGGAVTIDSDPESEYNETVTKIKNLMESIGYDSFLQ